MGKLQIVNNSCDRRDLEWQQVINYFMGNGWAVSYHEGNSLEKPLVDQDADMVIVASCAGLGAYKEWNIRTVEFINKTKNPKTRLVIGGCLPKIDPDFCKDYDTFSPRTYEQLDEMTGFKKKFNEFPRPHNFSYRIKGGCRTSGEMGTYEGKEEDKFWRIQIHEGCANKCAYCVIRLAIGTMKSKPMDEVLADFKKGLELGYKTISLEGDSVSTYGKDIKSSFGKLLDEIWEIVKDRPDIKITVPDYHPAGIKDSGDQILRLAENGNLAHLYIPVQSGSQKILDLMERNYKIEDVEDFIQRIHKENIKIKIGTSYIVGFPGETLDDVEETVGFLRRVKLDYAFMHPCSVMDNTKAAALPQQLDQKEIWRRCHYVYDELKEYNGSILICEEVIEKNKETLMEMPLIPNYILEHS